MTTNPACVVGIDLGTTNSSIAVVRDGTLTVIPVDGQPSMPSAVAIGPDGRLLVGQAAKNQAIAAPERTVLSVKRLMGGDATVELDGKTYRPEEISALILGELKRAAERFLGEPVSAAVITVPAFFNERQRHATRDAGKLAGLEVLRIINEPTAAALAYGAGQPETPARETLLVYDLGGGTFDVSVVEVDKGVVEVRASHGDVQLGGDDFDEALARWGEERFAAPDGGAPLAAAAHRRLKSAMEIAKIRLSDDPFASVREEYLADQRHFEAEVARHEYEELIRPLLDKTLDCIQRALDDAKLPASKIDKVMLVGGATRTPLVEELLRQRMAIEPRHEIDPDLVVAMGAAIQGAALAGQPAPAILIDITAHTYSVLALVEDALFPRLECVPLIRRGTPLPVAKSEVFTTSHDDQEDVKVEVYQGESPEPGENLKLGEFMVTGLSRVPAGNELLARFSIDLNGLLTVTATEKSTGLAKSIAIDTAGQHRLNLDAARSNLAALFEQLDAAARPAGNGEEVAEADVVPEWAAEEIGVFSDTGERESSPAALIASAKSLRRRAEPLLAADIAAADRAAIDAALAAVTPAIEARDWAALEDTLDRLSDLLFYLED